MENDPKLDRIDAEMAALEQYVIGEGEAWDFLMGWLDLDREWWLLTGEPDAPQQGRL